MAKMTMLNLLILNNIKITLNISDYKSNKMYPLNVYMSTLFLQVEVFWVVMPHNIESSLS